MTIYLTMCLDPKFPVDQFSSCNMYINPNSGFRETKHWTNYNNMLQGRNLPHGLQFHQETSKITTVQLPQNFKEYTEEAPN